MPAGGAKQSRRPGTGIAKGVAWLFVQTLGTRVCAFASQLIVAHILLPKDFAALALAGTITTLVAVLADFGTKEVLLQRLKRLNFWTATAFWMSLGTGSAAMLIVLLLAPIAAALYHAPVLTPMLSIIAISVPLSALSTVPTVMLRAALNFRFLALYDSAEFLAIQIMVITIAKCGGGPFSFVIPLPIAAAIKVIILWLVTRPKLGLFSIKRGKIMVSKGVSVFAGGLITVAVSQGDYVILGLTAPKPVVGAYYFAFRLAIQPLQLLAGSLSNVLFPTLAQMQDDQASQRDAVLTSSRLLGFTLMPYCFLQAALAQPLLQLAFGHEWDASIALMQILSIGLAFDSISWIAAALQSAQGRFSRALSYSTLLTIIFFGFIITGTLTASALGTACAIGLYYITTQPVFVWIIYKSLGISRRQVFLLYAVPVLFSALATSLALFATRQWHHGNAIQILVLIAVFCPVYILLVRLFAPATYHQVARLTSATFTRRHV
jgi:PST family polysaccharide transporter